MVFDEDITDVASRTRLWKVFTEMPVHGLVVTEEGGEEFPLLGGQDGRLFRYGRGQTDAGLLIPMRVKTAWINEGEKQRSFQPRWAYFHSSGEHGDHFCVDVFKDYEEARSNVADVRIPLGGADGVYWDAGRVWDFAVEWPSHEPKGGNAERMNLGTFFQLLQFQLSQNRENWRPGANRVQTFECSGWVLYYRMGGPREARTNKP